MSLEQMYQNRRSEIIARNTELLVKANAHTEEISSDGNSQLAVVKQDEIVLTEAGMDPALVIDLEETLGAYIWISALCDTKIASHHGDEEVYKQLKVSAYTLRRHLFKYGKFGCKKNELPEVLAELKEIIEGFGDEDMIYDMLKLYHLFTNNPTIPQGLLKFDTTWVDQSLQIHDELSALRASVKNPDAESEIAQLEQEVKQAYDLYFEKLNEVRDWGSFVFEGEERENEYKSEYMKKRWKKAKATIRANEAEDTSVL